MKLLIIHNFYTHLTGEDLAVEEIFRVLKDSGKMEVIQYYKYSRDFQKLSLIRKLITLVEGNIPFYVHKDFKGILDEEKPDIVQIHNLIPLINVWVLREIKKRKIPTMCSIHNYRIFCPRGTCFLKGKLCSRCFDKSLAYCILYNCLDNFFFSILYVYRVFLQRLFLRYIDIFVAPSKFVRDFYKARLPWRNIVILKEHVYVPEEIRNMEIEKNGFVIFAGRLVREKGILMVVRAAALMKDIEFKIFGEGPLLRYCEAIVRNKNLTNVEFLGSVDKYQLLRFVKESYALIFTSSWYEVFPRILVESLSLGTPPVAANIGVTSEIIEDGYNGLLYEPNNVEDLARKVRLLFDGKEFHNRISNNAKNIDLENTSDNYLKQLLDICARFRMSKANV